MPKFQVVLNDHPSTVLYVEGDDVFETPLGTVPVVIISVGETTKFLAPLHHIKYIVLNKEIA